MAAVTQIRNPDTQGRIYFERKVSEGKTKKEALRSLKRQISNAVYRQLHLDSRKGSGRTLGNDSLPAWSALHPEGRLFGEVTPGPLKAYAVTPSHDG